VTAGLPGIGIGGLFFLLSAIFMPVAEVYRTARGRSNAGQWKLVARQFVMAWVIIFAVERVLWIVKVITALVLSPPASDGSGGAGTASVLRDLPTTALPVVPILVTLACLSLVLASSYVMRLWYARRDSNPRPSGP
jgi:hypothetical protein